jgi:Holliday junction resolvase
VHRDTNHPAIVKELQSAGFTVTDLAAVGKDVPDLLIGRNGVDRQVEVKSDRKIHKKKGDGRSEGQIRYAQEWKGAPVITGTTTEQIISAFEESIR